MVVEGKEASTSIELASTRIKNKLRRRLGLRRSYIIPLFLAA